MGIDKWFIALLNLLSVASVHADWQLLNSPTTAELRGLSVVNDRVVWASGAKNTVIRSTDGERWGLLNAPQGEFDFRDIEAFSEHEAIIMSAGPGAASTLWLTQNDGNSWQNLFNNADEKGFWDAIAFWDRQHGVIFGDPVAGRFQIWLTQDGGEHWQLSPAGGMPAALEGEGAFAASGSCLSIYQPHHVAFVTGSAAKARAFVSHDGGQHFQVSELPIPVSAPSQGAFSVAWINEHTLITVGGDYQQAQMAGINAAISQDGGQTWQTFSATPMGFLSSVAVHEHSIAFTGLAGSSIGQLQQPFTMISTTPLNAVAMTKKTIFAVGPKGSLVKLQK